MGRKYIDCREIPGENHCTVAISADNIEELVEAAAQHAVAVHHHYNTQELRILIKRGIRDGEAPEAPPRPMLWNTQGRPISNSASLG